ncbi:SRPBCC family protein [Saccharomonospora viridis]|jgi:ribosome-associated toxin RatA of RatAB toxin-antitoxin module|uniref:Polyketide cyclase / dehydrase family protein n=2 Tax=Saccharomonospora viridis TaxID=1852 RepID=C7MZB6_SACVD|nr:SRPBCC family protein [Saccharomonospora viridis]ACU97483.1 polyketide cyclase / dehydrase family protein [Saccharomonospora viridis DSM 43017]KHF43686.1 cyclase [Saccharomonospora viridis]SFP86108.1 Polyketide cyclase / dehydrase and lipid transport [Saccharomonospora viridis]
MAEQSTQSIEIDAAPDDIMAVIADLPAYPEWAKAVRQTEILATDDSGRPAQVRFTLDSGPVKDVYTLAYDWADDGLSVSWRLVKGQMQKAQEGRYLLEPLGPNRTRVTYTLSVELALPMIGLLRRKAEKMIMDTALRELKRRVEGRS